MGSSSRLAVLAVCITVYSCSHDLPNLPQAGECTKDTECGQNRICDMGVCVDADRDNDGFVDRSDNCPTVPNPLQTDSDQDGSGDQCDVCPTLSDPNQEDSDTDGIGDACDNCRLYFNSSQMDIDSDGIGDACDNDIDDDRIANAGDNCPTIYNPEQFDADSDGYGDPCDNESDNDGYPDDIDNCPLIFNPDQLNTDLLDEQENDLEIMGDACDPDDDNDGIEDWNEDLNENGRYDIGIDTSDFKNPDTDGDGALDGYDNCILLYNPDQRNTDENLLGGDQYGNACDDDDDGDGISDIFEDINHTNEYEPLTDPSNMYSPDTDNDGIPDGIDNCIKNYNPTQANNDFLEESPGEIMGDACDPDDDNDNYLDIADNCPFVYQTNQYDTDQDGNGDACHTIYYFEDFESAPSHWIFNGSGDREWIISDTTNSYSGTFTLNNTNKITELRTAELTESINLQSAEFPILTYWCRSSFAADPNYAATVEVCTTRIEDGFSDDCDTAGFYTIDIAHHIDLPSEFSSWNEAWHTHRIDLRSFAGKNIKLRFSYIGSSLSGMLGWVVDDIKVHDYVKPTVQTAPYQNSMENIDDFYVEEEWAITSDRSYEGDNCLTVSEDGRTIKGERAAARIITPINVSNLENPRLRFYYNGHAREGSETNIKLILRPYQGDWFELPVEYTILAHNMHTHGNFLPFDVDLSGFKEKQGIEIGFYHETVGGINEAYTVFDVDKLEIYDASTDINIIAYPFHEDFEENLNSWDIVSGLWGTTLESAYAGSFSLHDSPASQHLHIEKNIIKTNGFVDLSTARQPQISFKIQNDISAYVDLKLNLYKLEDGQVKLLESITVLSGANDSQGMYQHVVIPITHYAGIDRLQLAFELDTKLSGYPSDEALNHNGVYIDEFTIDEWSEELRLSDIYDYPFLEDFETRDFNTWLYFGVWDLVTEATSGDYAMANSPYSSPQADKTIYIRTKGLIDLREAADPLLTFKMKFLTNTNQNVYVDIYPYDGSSFLAPFTIPLITGPANSSDYFSSFTIPLAAFVDSPYIGLAIKMHTGSSPYEGIIIDELYIQDTPVLSDLPIPYMESFEERNQDWSYNGNWQHTDTKVSHGLRAIEDSPDANVLTTFENAFEMNRWVDISSAVRPVVSYRLSFALGRYRTANFYLYDQNDSIIYAKSYGYSWNSTSTNFIHALHEIPNSLVTKVRARFAIENIDDDSAHVIIDKFEVYDGGAFEVVEPPYNDDVETDDGLWKVDGLWKRGTDYAVSGNFSWHDSPGQQSILQSTNTLTTSKIIDFTNATAPQLSWQRKVIINSSQQLKIEAIEYEDDNLTPIEVHLIHQQNGYLNANTFVLQNFDLATLIGKKARIRISVITGTNSQDGVWLDDISITAD